MEIIIATEKDLNEIQALWLSSFDEDDDNFWDIYKDTTFKKGETFLLKEGKELLCMLTAIKKKYVIGKKTYDTVLIEGIATPIIHRRKGYMKKLLDHAIEKYSKLYELIVIQAYKPEIYKPFGFVETHNLKYAKITCEGTEKIVKCKEVEHMFKIWKKYKKKFTGYHDRSLDDFNDFYLQVNKTNGYFMANEAAYICMWEDQIFELAYTNKNYLLHLLDNIEGEHKIRLAESEMVLEDKLFNVIIKNNTMLYLVNKDLKIEGNLYFPEYV